MDQLLPEKPLPASSGTLWRKVVLDSPSPDGSGARRHWRHIQMERAWRSIGNLLLLQSEIPLSMQQKKMEFEEKKHKYMHSFNASLFPMSAKVLKGSFFACKYEYADRQRMFVNCLVRIYSL